MIVECKCAPYTLSNNVNMQPEHSPFTFRIFFWSVFDNARCIFWYGVVVVR